jgi:hypothetical protein
LGNHAEKINIGRFRSRNFDYGKRQLIDWSNQVKEREESLINTIRTSVFKESGYY